MLENIRNLSDWLIFNVFFSASGLFGRNTFLSLRDFEKDSRWKFQRNVCIEIGFMGLIDVPNYENEQ